jgi:predicted transcriptional regulator
MEINDKNITKALNNIMSSMYNITVTYRTVMSQSLPTVTSAAIDLQSVTVGSAENIYCSPSVLVLLHDFNIHVFSVIFGLIRTYFYVSL